MSKKLHLQKINYNYKDLSPVMSEDTLRYHRDNLAKGYVTKYNANQGDPKFNEAGAFLHNIFFPQLREPGRSNKPDGSSLELITAKYETFDNFKEEFKKVALSIQGSGWVYMSTSGEIKTIPNHAIRKDIALLVDWWEHAWALDYQQDKSKYLDNIWKIINWDVVNDRINIKQSSFYYEIKKLADTLDRKGMYSEADALDSILKISRKKKKKSSKKSKSKRTPTNPKLWSRAKSEAKKRFDVYPSAYANGWAAKWYKEKGGGWRGPKPKKS